MSDATRRDRWLAEIRELDKGQNRALLVLVIEETEDPRGILSVDGD